MKLKIQLLSSALCIVSALSAQTTAVGTFKNKAGNGTAITAYTDSALGVGTSLPEGKAEIRYCPQSVSEHSGLLVTRVYCNGPMGISLGGGGGTLDGGLLDGNTGEGQSPTNGGVVQVPHYFTPVTPLRFPIQSINGNAAPLLWLKTQDLPSGSGISGNDNSRLLVLPDGRTGINVANPRAALDVRGYGQNTPVAIFGVRAQRSSTMVAGNPIPQQFTRHVEIVPDLQVGGYNDISQNGDLGIVFTDGLGNMGANANGALVIAPWSDATTIGKNAGGLRMEANGNAELRGNLRCTRLTVNAKWWPDAVFADDYRLMPLSEVANFIKKNRHLPGIPSEKTVLESGQDVGALQVLQQQKIEELTLYAIEQEKQLKAQQQFIAEQKKQLAAQETRLQKLEQLLNK